MPFLTFCSVAALLSAMPPASAHHRTTLPRGGNFVDGTSGTIARSGASLTVTQSSPYGIIDWHRFSVGKNGSVTFNNGSGATLNEVTGSRASWLMGTLTATGSVYLINQNGVLVGNGARINTGGSFVASTLNVDPGTFLNGGALTFSGSSGASVINRGAINAANGDVFLIARTVGNDGSVAAPNGTVGLAAGTQVLLQPASSDQRIFIQAPGGDATNTGRITAAQAELKAAGGNVYALAGNQGGVIAATGTATRDGHVWLTASGGGSVTVSSTITAQNADGAGGKVTVAGGISSGSATISGTIDVAAKAPGKIGGKVKITASHVALDATAAIKATGDAGGGTVEIGGGLHGADPHVANAQATTVSAGATIDASATGNGNGGTVAVWSNGTTSFDGTILAQGGPGGGDGGQVETSGHFLGIGATAVVSTAAPQGTTGTWLLDPVDVNITTNPTDGTETDTGGTFQASNTDTANINNGDIEAALGNTNVVITTACGGGACNGPNGGTITVASGADITWSSSNTLTLNADSNIVLDAAINGANGGLTLNAAGSITTSAAGAVNVAGFILQSGNWTQVSATLPSFTASNDFEIQGGSFLRALGGNGSSGNPYQIADVYGLQGVGSSTLLADNFVLANNINASGTASWNSGKGFVPIGNGTTPFTGSLNGAGYAISNLTINAPALDDVGLFGELTATGTVADIGLNNVSITGGDYVGALAGKILGSSAVFDQTYATGTVGGDNFVGGLVGGDVESNGTAGTISQSYAGVAVSGSTEVGGLVGFNGGGTIAQSYATGAVSGNGAVGGLVGFNNTGSISQSYSLGSVTGNSAGGLVGADNNGTVTSSYWDIGTSGQTTSADGTGLGDAAMRSASSFSNWSFVTSPGGAGWVIVDQDGTFNNAGGAAGATTPMLASEYATTITNSHQLQLAGLAPGATYELANNLNLSATGSGGDVWGAAGFAPIGNSTAPFSGIFDGGGHTISGLTINLPNASHVGLFGTSSGDIVNLGLTNASVTGSSGVGTLVGDNLGQILLSYASGNVTADDIVGGLVGQNDGEISESDAAATVNGGCGCTGVGGLVGYNTQDAAILQSFSTGAVTVQAGGWGGGLVGDNAGAIFQSDASGSVTGNSSDAIGGLVGENQGTIQQSFSTGLVVSNGSAAVGGLVGNNDNNILSPYVSADSFWDVQTSGQASGVGADPGGTFLAQGLTTAQAQSESYITANLVDNSIPSSWTFAATPDISNPWAIVDGVSYPYFAWRYPNGVEVVSGTAPTSGATVDLIANGASIGSSTVGANGYYYFAVDPGAVANSDRLLTYLPNGPAANAVSTFGSVVTGSDGTTSYVAAGLTLTTNTINLTGSGAVATSELATALGSNTGSAFLYSISGGTVDVSGGATLAVAAAGAITVDDAVSAPSNTVTLTAGGTITQTGTITAAILTTGSVGGTTLGASNAVASFNATNAGSGDVDLSDSAATLTVTGISQSGSGAVSISNGSGALSVAGTIGTGGGNVSLTGGSIGESGAGAISTTGLLTTSSVGGAALAGANTVGSFNAANVTSGDIDLSDSAATLTVTGVSQSGGDITIANTGNLTISGTIGGSGSVDLTATGVGHNLSLGAPITAQSFVAAAGGSITLSAGSTAVATAGGGQSYAGAVTLQATTTLADSGGGAISFNAAISGGANSLTLNAGSINLAAVTTTGTLTLDATGAITAPDAVSAGIFILQSGAWSQLGATLPSFSATDFRITGGSFLRVLGGDGSSGNPYQIADVYGLQGIGSSALLADNFILANSINASGAASWNSNAGFAPIGNPTTAFTGSLNGAGDTINALTIKQPSGSNLGLFGAIGSGGSVSNLGLTNVAITGLTNTGALAGNNAGTISNASVTGTVADTSTNSANNVGGLVGYNNGTITQSHGSATVTSAKNSNDVGGLVGENDTSGVISQSYATGNVTGTKFDDDLGGLVGYNDGTITQSYVTSTVTVTGTSGSVQWLGGLVGESDIDGIITNSYSNATVTGGTTGILIMVGGLTGENFGTISGSYNTGNVTGPDYVAGLVGQNDGTITQSYNTGAVSAAGSTGVGGLVATNLQHFTIGGFSTGGVIAQSYNSGAVINTGTGPTGGLLGDNLGGIGAGSVTQSYSIGSVTYTGTGASKIGGLVGTNGSGATITQGYSTGAVIASTSSTANIGGLVGLNQGAISQSYSAGQVTAKTGNATTGGLVGKNGAAATVSSDSFWDTQASGRATGFGTNANTAAGSFGAVGLTTALAQSATEIGTTLGWNIAGTPWNIVNGATDPFFAWRYQAIAGTAPAGATVAGLADGTSFGTTTAANSAGIYVFLLNAGTVAAGQDVLTYLSGGASEGNAVSSVTAIGAQGLALTANTITLTANGSAVTTSELATALGAASPSGALYSVAGGTVSVSSGVTLDVAAGSNSITIDDAVSAPSDTVTLTAGATISETGAGAIAAGLLTASSVGGTTLGGSNAVASFNVTNTTSGDIDLANSVASLTVTGVSQSGGGAVSIANSGGAMSLTGAAAADGGNVSLTATGRISESGAGAIGTTGLLTTSSQGGATLSGANTIGSFTATNTSSGDIDLTNTASTLTVTGVSQSGGGNLNLSNTGSLTTSGAIATGTGGANLTASGTNSNLTLDAPVTAHSFSATAARIIQLNYGTPNAVVTTSGGGQTYNAFEIDLLASTALVDSAGGGIALNEEIESPGNAGSLTLVTGGTETLSGVALIDNTLNLGTPSGLTLNGSSSYLITDNHTSFSFPNVPTTLNGFLNFAQPVTFAGAVRLGSDTIVDNTANVTFASTIDGAHSLTVGPGSATATFDGAIGGNTRLTTLAVNAGAIAFSGTVSASSLLLQSAGSVSLTGNNDVDTLAAQLTGAGSSLTLSDVASTLTVGTVNGISGITTNDGAVSLTTGFGGQTLSQAIATGTGAITLSANSAISETGSGLVSTTGLLTTSSLFGTTLNNANAIGSFNGSDSGGSAISLTNTAATLTVTGGSAGAITINNTGAIALTGAVASTNGSEISLTATGAISESGSGALSTTGELYASATGSSLTGANTVGSFVANNTGSGDVALNNTAADLQVLGISQSGGGNVIVNNTGALTIGSSILANPGGNISLTATGGSLTVNDSVIAVSGSVSLAATGTTSDVAINAQVEGSALDLAAGGAITEGANGFLQTVGLLTTGSGNGTTLGSASNFAATFSGSDGSTTGISFIEGPLNPTGLTIAAVSETGTGAVSIANTDGALVLTGTASAGVGGINLTAAGTISESGGGLISTPGTLTTSSTGGTTLGGANTVAVFNATDQFAQSGVNVVSLTNTATTLTITGVNAPFGSLAISNTGAIAVTGLVATFDSVSLTATGAISESGAGAISAPNLTTSSAGGTSLTGANAVNDIGATNTLSGDVSVTNTSANVSATIVQSGGGNVTVDNTGNLGAAASTTGNGNISLTATNGALFIGGHVTAGGSGSVTLTSTGAGNGITLDGATVSSTSGAITLTSGDSIVEERRPTVPVGTFVTGSISTGGLLTTNSQTGTTLSGAGINNAVGSFNGTDAGGAIALANTAAALTVTGASAPGGVAIANTGDLVLSSTANPGTGGLNLTASGNLTLDNSLTVAGSAGIALTAGSALTLNGVVTPDAFTLSAGSLVLNSGTYQIGNGAAYAFLAVPTTTNGTLILDQATTFDGAVTLGSDTTLDSSAQGNPIIFNNTIDATTAGGQALTVDAGSGAVTFASTVGTTALSSLSASGGALAIAGAITAQNAVTLTSTGSGNSLTLSTGILGGGGVTLTAAGEIDEIGSGTVTTGTGGVLTTTSSGGTYLNNVNGIDTFAATNTGSGDIQVDNGATNFKVGSVSQSGGGAISVTNDAGIMALVGAITADGGEIDLSAAAIRENGGLVSTSGTLTTSSGGGTSLTGANAVGGFNASNTTSGNIALTNTAATLTVTGVTGTVGNVTVNNTGNLALSGSVNAGTNTVSLTAGGGAITQTGGTLTAATLSTSSGTGTALTQANAFSNFTGSNATSGDIDVIDSSGGLTLQSVTNSGGGVTIANTNGTFATSGTISSGANGGISLGTTNATMTIGAAVTANGSGTISLIDTGLFSDIGIDAAVSSSSGGISITAGQAIGENASGSLGTSGLLTTNSGNGTVLTGANTVGSFNATDAWPAGISLTNTAATLTLTGVTENGTGGVTIANTGSLALAGTVSSSATGNAVVLSATGNFTNSAGANAITAANGRWLVYSAAPAGDSFNGLDSGNTAIWNATDATLPPSSVAQPGNRYVFALQPTATLSANITKTYGTTADLTTEYSVSGLDPGVAGAYRGDTAATAFSGAPILSSAGAAGTATVAGNPYLVTVTLGTATALDGYALAVANGQLTVTPATLTASLSGTVSKTYDGSTAATLAVGDYQLAGIVNSDIVTLNNPVSGTYDTKDAGTGKLVTVSGLAISGADAGNYVLASSSVSGASGTITPATLSASLSGTVSKIYDGTSTAKLTSSNYVLSGVVGGDSVATSGTAAYASATVGSGIAIQATGLTLSGADAGNYVLGSTNAGGASGSIAPATLTYVADPVSRVSGTANPTFTGSVNGLVGNDTLASATTGSIVFTTLATLTSGPGRYAINGSGLAAGNYVFAQDAGNANALTILSNSSPQAVMPPNAAELLALQHVNTNWAALPSTGLAPSFAGGWAPLGGWLAQFQGSGGNSLVAQNSIFLDPITYVGGGIVTAALPPGALPSFAPPIYPW